MKVQIVLPGVAGDPITVEAPPETETIRTTFYYEDHDVIVVNVDAVFTVAGQACYQQLLSTQIIYRPYFGEVANEC